MSEVQLLGCTCFRLLSMWHDMRQEVHVEMTWSEITAYLVSPARTHGISWHGTTFIAIRKLLANPSNRHLVAVLKVTMLASNSARCIWRSTSGLVHGIRSHCLTGSYWVGLRETMVFTSQTWRFSANVPSNWEVFTCFFVIAFSPSS